MKETARVVVHLPAELDRRLRDFADREDRTVSSVVRLALRAYLEDDREEREAA